MWAPDRMLAAEGRMVHEEASEKNDACRDAVGGLVEYGAGEHNNSESGWARSRTLSYNWNDH